MAGSLKLLDPKIAARRAMEFISWGVGLTEGLEAETYEDQRQMLETFGFDTPEQFEVVDSANGILAFPQDAIEKCYSETQFCDCMIVAGTSATVYPAAGFPMAVRDKGGSLIEVNLYESELTPLCTVSLRGSSGSILRQLVETLKAKRP